MVLLELVKRLIAQVQAVLAAQRSRRQLLDMDCHRLYDIGLTEHEAREEGRKPVWKR